MAMNTKSLRDRVKEFKVSLPLMEGREKGDFSRLIGTNVTILDFGFMKDDDKEYVAFIVGEDPQHFYFGGQVITDQMRQLEEEGFGEEIREKGLPVLFNTRKSKNKRDYTTVEFYPEDK